MDISRTELENGEKVLIKCEVCGWVYLSQNTKTDWVGEEHVTKCPKCEHLNMTDIWSSVYLYDRIKRTTNKNTVKMKVIRKRAHGQDTFIDKACDEIIKMVQPYSKIRLGNGDTCTNVHLVIEQGRNIYNTRISIRDSKTNRVKATGHIQRDDSVFFVDKCGNNIDFLN